MGFFGTYLYTDGTWAEIDVDADFAAPPGPFLFVSIHDSDIATVRYSPTGAGTGEAFLGYTPRAYFDDPSASIPTDTAIEAAGLAAWAHIARTGASPNEDVVERFLAGDDDDGVDGDDDEDLPDEEVFVELRMAKLLQTLGLPTLPALQ